MHFETIAAQLVEMSYSSSRENAAQIARSEGQKIGYSEYLLRDGSHITIDIGGQVHDTTADYKHHRSSLGLDKATETAKTLTADELMSARLQDLKRERRERARRMAAFPKFGTV